MRHRLPAVGDVEADHEIRLWDPNSVCSQPPDSPSTAGIGAEPVRAPWRRRITQQPFDADAEPMRACRHLGIGSDDVMAASILRS